MDSGSDLTLIPASLVKDEEIRQAKYKLAAANGTDMAPLGEVSLPFSVGDFNYELVGYVTEHVAVVMLGIGWMERNDVMWEFGRDRIKIGKNYYGSKCAPESGTWCRRVFLQQDVVFPPRTAIDLPTAVVMHTLPRDGEAERHEEPNPLW